MNGNLPAPTIDGSFAHHWQAEILANRPLILPKRHFVYPTQAEEVERGALEVLVRPSRNEAEFLATCASAFATRPFRLAYGPLLIRTNSARSSGGYAYIIDTVAPERFTMIAFGPCLRFALFWGGLSIAVPTWNWVPPVPSAAGGGTGDCTQSSENALSAGFCSSSAIIRFLPGAKMGRHGNRRSSLRKA